MDKKKLVELLNVDLTKEYAAAIQYIQHAALITGAQFSEVVKELRNHADEEIKHAMVLSEQINFLGGIPTMEVSKIQTSRDNVKMLEQDLEGEEEAISRYKQRVEQAENLKEFALAHQLRTILAVEQEHAMDLKQALGR